MENQQKPVTEETAKRLVELLTHAPTATLNKSVELAKKPVLRIRNSQIAAGVTGSVGLILFALGIENLVSTIPAFSSPSVEILFGLILLSVSGLLLKKLV